MLGRDVLMGCMIMQAAAKTRLGSRPEKAIGLGFWGGSGMVCAGSYMYSESRFWVLVWCLSVWGDGDYWGKILVVSRDSW